MEINKLNIEGIGANRRYVDKNNTPGQERPGTLLKALIFNQFIEELQENFIKKAGLTPSDTDTGQIKKSFDIFMNRLESKLSNKDNQLSQKIDTTKNELYSSLRGNIMAFAGNIDKIPTNAFFCDGRELSRITYARLFEKIGTYWGAGNGTTTFNIPDGRSGVLMGTGWSGQWTHQENISLGQKVQTHMRRLYGDSMKQDIDRTNYGEHGGWLRSGIITQGHYLSDYAVRAVFGGGANKYFSLAIDSSLTQPTGNTFTPNAIGVNFIIFV